MAGYLYKLDTFYYIYLLYLSFLPTMCKMLCRWYSNLFIPISSSHIKDKLLMHLSFLKENYIKIWKIENFKENESPSLFLFPTKWSFFFAWKCMNTS